MSKGFRVTTWAAVVKAFVDGKVTRNQIKERTGFSHDYVVNIFNAFEEQGLIHCCGLTTDRIGRERVEVFTFGPDPHPGKFRKRNAKVKPKTTWRGGFTFPPMPEKPKGRRKPLAVIPESVRQVATTE